MLRGLVLSGSTVAVLFTATLGASLPAQARPQPKLDRTKVPEPSRAADLKVPAWTTTKLSNGADLTVSPKRELPLVSVNINFLGGANQFENPEKLGVASLTAQMLSEGTTTKTGNQLADAQQLLGTQVRVNISGERSACW